MSRFSARRKGYFYRVIQQFGSRFWINNPSIKEVKLAIKAGAVGCTTNPTYAMRLLEKEEEHDTVINLIKAAVDNCSDDRQAAQWVYRMLIKRIIPYFKDIYKQFSGNEGFVTLQVDPVLEQDYEYIVNESLINRTFGPNVMMKIPVTHAGLEAIRQLVPQKVPIMATEVMSLSQAIRACEVYTEACEASKVYPPFFLAHISGAFDDYIWARAMVENIDIDPRILDQAGCIIARRQFKVLHERNYPITFLGGGAKKLYHFTELVGGPMHLTINWEGTADTLLSNDPPLVDRLHIEEPPEVLRELLEKVKDFRRAYEHDGLDESEFAYFGPVVLFRNSFINGWDYLIEQIRNVRMGTDIKQD